MIKTKGEYYIPQGWLNDNTLLYSVEGNQATKFFVLENGKEQQKLDLEGNNPRIILIENNKIVYFPGYNQSNHLIVAECVDLINKTSEQHKQMSHLKGKQI